MLRIERAELQAFAETLIEAEGAPGSIAASVADSLVTADLRGHVSHGVRHLAGKYHREVQSGRIDPAAEPAVAAEGDTWTQIDGNDAYGQLVGRVAADAAIDTARDTGVGVSTLKHTSHIGRVGEFAEMAAAEGMVFTAFVCNPGSAWVAPAGSAQRRFSTNPIAFGVPTFDGLDFDFVMDIATSQVAHGKIRVAAAADDRVPDEWLVDESGNSMPDATRFEQDDVGGMLPLGGLTAGYKGTNLSVMSELMAANLADGTVSGEADLVWGNHAVFTAVDLTRFTTPERAAQRARAMADYVRSTDFSAGHGPGAAAKGDDLLLPGEYEYESEADHRARGIEMQAADAARLRSVAADLGVEAAIPEAIREA